VGSKYQELLQAFLEWKSSRPSYVVYGGLTLAFVIIVDGAILFFTICGAFSYLSVRDQALILEWSMQIINAAFAILCAYELPYRVRMSARYSGISCSADPNKMELLVKVTEEHMYIYRLGHSDDL
jgi:hypothetical protein